MNNITEDYQDLVEDAAELAVKAGLDIGTADAFLLKMEPRLLEAGHDFVEFVGNVHAEMLIIIPIWNGESMSRVFKDASTIPGANTQ